MISRSLKILAGKLLSPFVPIRKGRTAIVAKSRVPFAGNLRVMADALLEQGEDVLIYKDGPIDPAVQAALLNAGARVKTGFSLLNLVALLRCETIMIGHSIRDAHISVRKPGRRIVNLWHGVPLKRIELLMGQVTDQKVDVSRQRLMQQNAKLYDWVLACNETDRHVMAEAFGVSIEQVIPAGLPRFDYLREEFRLPPDLAEAEKHLLRQAKGRRIVLYAPTFREETVSPLRSLDKQSLADLDNIARRLNLVIAIRPHPYDRDAVSTILDQGFPSFIDAGVHNYPETAVVLRVSDLLITDYSSVWVDFLLTGRKLVAFVPDLEHYATRERGFIHDLQAIFPGAICRSWNEVCDVIQNFASKDSMKVSAEEISRREVCRQLLLPSSSLESVTHVLLKHLALDENRAEA